MNRFKAYLQLVRLPAVFSAWADIALGMLLAHDTLYYDDCLLPFALLLLTSTCLYWAGMTFNDVFDVEIDAKERPQRPIPSSRISKRAAIRLGCGLMLAGSVSALFAGRFSFLVAIILSIAVLAYDGWMKKTHFGPLAMGSCRFLNVMLGASLQPEWSSLWVPLHWQVAACLGIYIVGVTWFAREESGQSHRSGLFIGMMIANLGLVLLAVCLFQLQVFTQDTQNSMRALFVILMVGLIVNRRAVTAFLNPSPSLVQVTVKVMLLSLIFLDAAMIYARTDSLYFAFGAVALVIPALLLSRWVYLT